MSSIAIITARGGSKRIPRKNIKNFCGRPIISYSIEAAKISGLFDEVMVSTDDKEIATVAQQYGANIPFMRSEKNADDYATTADVLQEVLLEYEKRGKLFDVMCCLYPTAPFVTAKRLQEAYTIFIEKHAEEVVPVVQFSYPPQRGFILKNGILSYAHPQYIRARSQDLAPLYHDAGQFYFYDIKAFIKGVENNSEMGAYTLQTFPLLLNEIEVQDIDNLSDWTLAELKYRILHPTE